MRSDARRRGRSADSPGLACAALTAPATRRIRRAAAAHGAAQTLHRRRDPVSRQAVRANAATPVPDVLARPRGATLRSSATTRRHCRPARHTASWSHSCTAFVTADATIVNPDAGVERSASACALDARTTGSTRPTIAHWHGLAVDTAQRRQRPRRRLRPAERHYAYDFEVRDRGALYWYHPHPHGSTARQMLRRACSA